ncbi:helix-turn-helix transcriptional regulator [Cryobacterium sp. PH29-G1]|nr:helix-turn-helix transcriptional regulator [Cryobacterium sp. PH29-G1]
MDAWVLPPRLLIELEQIGIADWDDDWLVLHPYVRGVLFEDAEKMLSAEERRRLLDVAVRSSLLERDPLSALRAAFLIQDLELATEVVFQNMIELLESRDTTYRVFTSLPASQLRGHPVLTIMLVLLSHMDPQTRPRAVQLLASESLFQRLQPGRGTHRERVAYQIFEVAALRLTPLATSVLPRVRRAFDELAELSDEDMEKLGRLGPALQVHLGISAFYLRNYALARQCFELAEARHTEAGRNDRVDPLALRGGLAALSGELPTARRLLDEADRATWPAGWRTSSPADFFNLGRAILALEEGDTHSADAYIRAAGPIEDVIEHWTLFAWVRSRRDQPAGEADLGLLRLKQLRKTRGPAPGTALSRSFLDAAEAELLLSTGDLDAARRVAARSAKHSDTCRVVLAWAELALGRSSSAARQAQRVVKDPLSAPRSHLEADLVLLCVASRNEFEDEVRGIAERVAERLTETELRSTLRFIAPQDQDALTAALIRAGVDRATVSLIGSEITAGDSISTRATHLTSREQTVLELLDETPALDEIADRLFVSRNTVKSQLASIYRKMGVSSRDAALTRAAVLGILD